MVSFGEGSFPPLAVVFGGGGCNLGIKDGNLGVGGVCLSEGITFINERSYLRGGLRDNIFAKTSWDGMFRGCEDSFSEGFFASLAGSGVWERGEKLFGFCGEGIPVGFFEVEISLHLSGLSFVRIRVGDKDRKMIGI